MLKRSLFGVVGWKMEKASTDVIQLSELVEKPSNLDRWRVLPGRDNNYTELTQKALAVEEFLSAKEDQAYEKDLVLEEVLFSSLYSRFLGDQILVQTKKELVDRGMSTQKRQPNLKPTQVPLSYI